MEINRPSFPARPSAALGPSPVGGGTRRDFAGAPVAFTASVTDLTPGNFYTFNVGTLQPGFRTPYFIDEIRINAYSDVYTNAGGLNPRTFTGLAGLLEFKFQTGNYAFSREYIPAGLYAPRWSLGDFGSYYGGGATTQRRGFCTIRWPLPKPLWLAPGDAVQALVRYRNYASVVAQNLTISSVNVTYIGRLAPVGSRAQPQLVPWVAAYRKDGTVSFAQTNDEFRNPFALHTLQVQRFTSRTFREDLSGGTFNNSFIEATDNQGPNTISPTLQPYTEAKLTDSLGYAIVPSFTPLNDVFDGTRAAWTFGRTLGPREQFDLQLRAAGATTTDAGYNIWSMVGMVGFREEK